MELGTAKDIFKWASIEILDSIESSTLTQMPLKGDISEIEVDIVDDVVVIVMVEVVVGVVVDVVGDIAIIVTVMAQISPPAAKKLINIIP